MFMQSFENSSKQQQRRIQRQIALQRMEEAANVALSTVNVLDDDDDINDLHSGDMIGTLANNRLDRSDTDQNHYQDNATEKKTSNSLTSAANFLRESQNSYSFEPASITAAAKQFLWDDQSINSSNTDNLNPRVNLQTIKHNTKKPHGGKGARWNAINGGRSGGGGLLTVLPTWGGRQQGDAASVASGGSKYRDVEGERLLTLANERVNIDKMSALDTDFENADDDAEEGDYDSLLRRRVFLNKDGIIHQNGSDESLSSRRLRKTCWRTIRRPAILIFAVGIAIAIASGTMTMYSKFMTNNDSNVIPTNGHDENDKNSKYGLDEIPPPVDYGEKGPSETKLDKERLDQVRNVILESRTSTLAAIQDTTSAQFAGLMWITRDDPRQLDPNDAYFLQRYVLAVLWFSTTRNTYRYENDNNRMLLERGIDKWFKHDHWLSELGVCDWSGITCNPREGSLNQNESSDGDVTSIDLRRNNLRGLFPSDVFRALPFLEALDLSDNALSGTISEDIGKLSYLELFNFTANNIEGSLPDSIGDNSQLRIFHISFNQLGDTIPYSIYKLKELQNLDLSRNSLAATIPHEIGAMKELRSLNLAYNSLEGSLPHELIDLQNLIKLDISHNNLHSSLPKEIGLVTYLRHLDLSHNQFEGDLPKEIGDLEHLDELYLNDNDFKGSIPSALSNLTSLDVLNLSTNDFTGVFPNKLTEIYGLKVLDISNNDIKGEIPTTIGDLKNIEILNLATNDIIGMIPSEIGSLYKLEQIFLEDNELIGSVPEQLGELTSLRKLVLHNNFLTGFVSDRLCKLSKDMFLTQFSVDCAGESSVIRCGCCQCHEHETIIREDDA